MRRGNLLTFLESGASTTTTIQSLATPVFLILFCQAKISSLKPFEMTSNPKHKVSNIPIPPHLFVSIQICHICPECVKDRLALQPLWRMSNSKQEKLMFVDNLLPRRSISSASKGAKEHSMQVNLLGRP